MMHKKVNVPGGRVQIGISSLILIFTVLCLVIFAALSLSSATADHKLAVKNRENIQSYYAADSKAELKLKEIDDFLIDAAAGEMEFQTALTNQFQDAYDTEHKRLSFTIAINEEQSIDIRLRLKSAEEIRPGGENYTVERWKVYNEKDYEIDESMNVWDGNQATAE